MAVVTFMVFIAYSGVINLLKIFSVWWPTYHFSIFKIICALAIFSATSYFSLRIPALAVSVGRLFNLLITTQQLGEKLRRSEEFLDRTNRLAGIGGWELDLLTEEFTWSAQMCQILGAPPGYKPTLAEGLRRYAASAHPIITEAIQVASSGGAGWDLELPAVRFDGRHIWARTVGSAGFENGKVVRLSGAFQDITTKVEAREVLRQANEHVSLATDSGKIGIWDWNVETGGLICNAWMYRLHGKDPTHCQPVDFLWRNHLHPDDRVRVEQALEDAVQGVSEYDTEFRIIWEDGSVHTVCGTARVTRNDEGRAMSVVGATWDVSESRQFPSQLAEQHERLRATLRSIGDGVVTTDACGSVVWLNPMAERLTGWSTMDAIGRPLKEVLKMSIVEGPPLEKVNCSIPDDAIRPAQDAKLIARDGTEYGVESTAATICNKLGDHLGNVPVFRDVTEKRRLMVAGAEAAKAQLKLKDEFLSHVPHELRSLLTSIYSFSSIIADDPAGETTAQQKEYLQIAPKNVAQLRSTIENPPVGVQSREAKLVVKPERVVPLDAIVDTLETVQGAAAKKQIQLSLGDFTSVAPVYADPVRLRQVLTILLHNAIKFKPSPGKISIHVSERDAEFVLIQVQDAGCGVPLEKWALISENLDQVNETSHADTSQAGRAGLGPSLHIARNLVHRQGGDLWVKSIPYQGSVFSFTMPVYSGQDGQI